MWNGMFWIIEIFPKSFSSYSQAQAILWLVVIFMYDHHYHIEWFYLHININDNNIGFCGINKYKFWFSMDEDGLFVWIKKNYCYVFPFVLAWKSSIMSSSDSNLIKIRSSSLHTNTLINKTSFWICINTKLSDKNIKLGSSIPQIISFST